LPPAPPTRASPRARRKRRKTDAIPYSNTKNQDHVRHLELVNLRTSFLELRDGADPRKVRLRAGDGQRTDWARSRSRRLRAAHEPGRREDSKAHHMLGWLLHEREILISAQADARTLSHSAPPRSPRGIVPSSSSTRPGARPSNRADQIGGALSRRAPRGAKGTSRSQLSVKPTTAARLCGLAPHHPVRAEYTDKPPRAWKMTPVVSPSRPALSLQLRQCQCTYASAGLLTF